MFTTFLQYSGLDTTIQAGQYSLSPLYRQSDRPRLAGCHPEVTYPSGRLAGGDAA
jgi:hypothetical protein